MPFAKVLKNKFTEVYMQSLQNQTANSTGSSPFEKVGEHMASAGCSEKGFLT